MAANYTDKTMLYHNGETDSMISYVHSVFIRIVKMISQYSMISIELTTDECWPLHVQSNLS